MVNNYVSIIDQLKEELLSWVDEDHYFLLGKDFMRFKFRTDDKLVYNQRVNIPVFVISLSCVIKKGYVYYPQFRLQKCFYEFHMYSIDHTDRFQNKFLLFLKLQRKTISYVNCSSPLNFDFVFKV